MKKEVYKSGIVISFEGKFWGIECGDAASTCYGYVDIDKAIIYDRGSIKNAIDVVFSDSEYRPMLEKGKLLIVSIKTVYVVPVTVP